MNCETCKKKFKTEEALNQHKKSKHSENLPKENKLNFKTKKKIKTWTIIGVVLLILVGGPIYLLTTAKTLPPTNPQGHIEESPTSHILKQPMSDAVQKHMLEHSDGKGRPGVIINYNCKKYDCEDDLIPKLEKFAKNSTYIYVTPYPKMDAKITITAFNRIKIFNEYNELAIQRFIDLS